jgi:hypothetical protein
MSDKAEYTLTKDITTYTYPFHMKRPEGFMGSNFFEKWIPKWQTYLGHFSNKPNVLGIEIGAYNGDCAVFCADRITNGENSLHYTIDITETEYLTNNIVPYKNIRFMKGKSYDILRDPSVFISETVDYVYVDGSNLAIDVLSDAVLSWNLLKDGGILIFNNYGWGIHTTDEKQKPKLGIDAFLNAYQGNFQMLDHAWQVFLKKSSIKYKYDLTNLQMKQIT